MLNSLLDIVKGDGSDWAGQNKSPSNFYFDNFGEPFLYALIGFLVVFVGIVLIIFIIWLVGLIMRKSNNLEFLTKKREKKEKVEPQPLEDSTAKLSEDEEIPDEIKAAIVAALMAYYEEKQEKCHFSVKRIKRI